MMPSASAWPAPWLLVFVTVLLSGGVPANAQQITGAPGLPSATTTIDGQPDLQPPRCDAGKFALRDDDTGFTRPASTT
jgi:hypothetical protein